MHTKTPIRWQGGKGLFASKIVPYLDRYPHDVYVEPFGGGASVLLAKRQAKTETYNDLDGALYDFFSVMSDLDLFRQFHRIVTALPYSRRLYNEYAAEWRAEPDRIRRVAKWFVVARQSFGGRFGAGWGFSCRGGKREPYAWANVVAGLEGVHRRLVTVQIENKDFRSLITAFSAPGTLFYCDPPYVWETRIKGTHAYEMSLDDHADLGGLARDNVFILSGYDHEVYRPLDGMGYIKKTFDVPCHVGGKVYAMKGKSTHETGRRRTECLWIHPEIVNRSQMGLFG